MLYVRLTKGLSLITDPLLRPLSNKPPLFRGGKLIRAPSPPSLLWKFILSLALGWARDLQLHAPNFFNFTLQFSPTSELNTVDSDLYNT